MPFLEVFAPFFEVFAPFLEEFAPFFEVFTPFFEVFAPFLEVFVPRFRLAGTWGGTSPGVHGALVAPPARSGRLSVRCF